MADIPPDADPLTAVEKGFRSGPKVEHRYYCSDCNECVDDVPAAHQLAGHTVVRRLVTFSPNKMAFRNPKKHYHR